MTVRPRTSACSALVALVMTTGGLSAQEVTDAPDVILAGVPFEITVAGGDAPTTFELLGADGSVVRAGTLPADQELLIESLVVEERAVLPISFSADEGRVSSELAPTFVPGWFSLIPPLLAIVLALVFREVVTALFAGVWLGALAVAGFDPLAATWRTIDTFIVPALGDVDGGHTQIVVFSLLLGGMVGVIARNGGTMGIVEAVRPFARTGRRGRIATWLAGLAVFFDDYANTLIVGTTMRPITDRLRVSREKLAYLVDSTAAPIAALVPISTWVGYEISLIADGLGIAAAQNPGAREGLLAMNPFSVFVETIPYRFYPLLALYFAGLTALIRRDFGPMASAEIRAAERGELHRRGAQLMTDTSERVMEPKSGAPHRWWNAAVPVITVVLVVLGGLYTTGRSGTGPAAPLREVFGAADPFVTLLWGSLAGCLVAIGLSLAQRILTVQESVEAWVTGMRAMLIAMVILTLAWSLGAVTEDVGTAAYLSQILSNRVALHFLPVIVFATAAAMSFATGTSWGTMAILLPLVIPLTVALGGYDPAATGGYSILLGAISSVLAGAIFGDHCSPISDTTVLSSMASGCDHMDHVRTQLPYALLVGVVGMAVGDVGTALGLPVWVALLLGMALLYGFLRWKGSVIERDEAASP